MEVTVIERDVARPAGRYTVRVEVTQGDRPIVGDVIVATRAEADAWDALATAQGLPPAP